MDNLASLHDRISVVLLESELTNNESENFNSISHYLSAHVVGDKR